MKSFLFTADHHESSSLLNLRMASSLCPMHVNTDSPELPSVDLHVSSLNSAIKFKLLVSGNTALLDVFPQECSSLR